MDSALKQRLIGAAVLVALAVILLPMLLQGPAPDDGAADVPLQMPEAPDRDFETRELPLAAPAPNAPENGATGLDPDDPNRVATVDAGGTPAPRMDASADASPAPAADPTPPAAAETAPAQNEPIPAAQSGGRYVVNLGIYANRANASALVDSLKKAGLPAYAESATSNGKPAQRVRLGPFEQRSAAESARLRARDVRADVPASVAALDAASPAPETTAPAAPASPPRAPTPTAAPPAQVSAGYAVQVAAFRTEGDATALRDRLRAGGFSALTERVNAESGTLFRVRVGPTAQRAEADRLRAQVAERFKLNGMVVSYP